MLHLLTCLHCLRAGSIFSKQEWSSPSEGIGDFETWNSREKGRKGQFSYTWFSNSMLCIKLFVTMINHRMIALMLSFAQLLVLVHDWIFLLLLLLMTFCLLKLGATFKHIEESVSKINTFCRPEFQVTNRARHSTSLNLNPDCCCRTESASFSP